MSGIVTGQKLGMVLCDMLGLDPKRITRITVVCDVKDIARVTINQLVHMRQVPVIQLSPRVNVSDAFRRDMDAWLLEQFGTKREKLGAATRRFTVHDDQP